MNNRFLFAFFFVFLCCRMLGAEELSLDQFLARARHPNPVATYAALDGTIQHQRRGAKLKQEPIYFSVILQPERMTGQLILGEKEGFLLGQARTAGEGETSVVPMRGSDGKSTNLDEMGVRASDLTMSFLFYPAIAEEAADTLRTVPCRVVLLEKPDETESVRVYITRDYYFPLKAEFTKKGETAPYRTLEVNAFKKVNDLYYPSEISLSGPGWRTRISFDRSAAAGLYLPENPPDIFRKL